MIRDIESVTGIATSVLKKLDRPQRKSENPMRPIVVEFCGLAKAGKDTQLVQIDRWLRARKYKLPLLQESAENKDVRAMPRIDAYAYEMRHFTYTFTNLLDAATSRIFHANFLNRGIVDTLCHLEWHFRNSTITERQKDLAHDFILEGPWMNYLDAIFVFICDIETALEREYGKDHRAQKVKFGSRMNPDALALMRECIDKVVAELRDKFPNLPLYTINTTSAGIAECRDEILSRIFDSVERRLEMTENDTLLWSPTLLRKNAVIYGPALKVRAHPDENILRRLGWEIHGQFPEKDIYLRLKDQQFLEDDECFHLREWKGHYWLYYKRGGKDPTLRAKVCVPVPSECVEELLAGFDEEKIVVLKDRRVFVRRGFLLDMDEVEGFGQFIEIKAPPQNTVADLLEIVKEFGLPEANIVRESYLMMHLKRLREQAK